MPDQSATDIVMRFTYGSKPGVLKGGPTPGAPVYGECYLAVDKGDDFMDGFVPASSTDDYSNFFEVLDFSFGFAAREGSDSEEAQDSLNAQSKVGNKILGDAKTPEKKPGLAGEFAKWRSKKEDEYKKDKFGVDLQNFSFSRLIDAASPRFIEWCAKSFTFQDATLVKRISRGVVGGNAIPQGYLRLEFENVILTSVKWSDGEVVVENCTMKFTKLTTKYKRQMANGDLVAAGTNAVWDREKHTDPNRK